MEAGPKPVYQLVLAFLWKQAQSQFTNLSWLSYGNRPKASLPNCPGFLMEAGPKPVYQIVLAFLWKQAQSQFTNLSWLSYGNRPKASLPTSRFLRETGPKPVYQLLLAFFGNSVFINKPLNPLLNFQPPSLLRKEPNIMHNILLSYDAHKRNQVWLQKGWPVHKTWDTHKHYFKDFSTFVMTPTFNSSLNSSNGACKLSSSIPSLAAKDSAVQNMYLTILSLVFLSFWEGTDDFNVSVILTTIFMVDGHANQPTFSSQGVECPQKPRHLHVLDRLDP